MALSIKSPASPAEFDAYYMLCYEVLRRPWGGAYEECVTDGPSVHRMIVDDDGQVLAVGRIVPGDETGRGQIRFVAVREDHQGQGLGAQLMRALEQAGAEQGWSEIFLNAREVAFGFYQKLGYQTCGESLMLVGILHLPMLKTIEPLV